MNHFSARCDYQHLDIIKGWLSSIESPIIFLVEENPRGENHHCHFIFTSPYKRDNLRKKRAISNVPKGQKALKFTPIEDLNDLDKIYRYYCKGFDVTKPYHKFKKNHILPKVIYKEFDDNQVTLYHDQFWSEYENIKEEDKTKSNETVGEAFLKYAGKQLYKKYYSKMYTVYAKLHDEEPEDPLYEFQCYVKGEKDLVKYHKEFVNITASFFGGKKKCFDNFVIVKYMNLLEYTISPEAWSSYHTESILSRF